VHLTLNENTAAEPRFGAPLEVQIGPAGAKQAVDVGVGASPAVSDAFQFHFDFKESRAEKVAFLRLLL
jgi:hypothetical protein